LSDLSGVFAVVLGGSGFIGSAVAARLVACGAKVRVVARSPGTPVFSAETVAADLTSPGAVASVVAGADVVLPLVLYTGGGTWRAAGDRDASRVNVDVVAAAAAAGVAVVSAGSTSQVGAEAPAVITGEETDCPATEYDRQKAAAEAAVLAEGGVSLRLPVVFGPPAGLDRGVVSAMARRALAGEPLTVWGSGGMVRDLVHISDVADAFVAGVACADRLAGRHWVIGSGEGVPVVELFTLIAATVAEQTGRVPVPVMSVEPPAHASPMDLRGLVADPAAFTAVTGWRPTMSLADAVANTVAGLLRA
jgi:dTDP-4-keto-6-deoxyhexose 4-ketoreductase